jgi:glycosyltransferase involved in cell wall biosynthesis
MEDSARWMLEFVLPLVKRDVPDIHFYIAGRGSDKILADVKDENVTVAGELPSVLPYLTNASVAIVPLRFESGTRFKILEAGACGIPVVSTTLGAEGIPTTDGKDILIADTPEDFAHAIIAVIRDSQLADSLGSNLKELVTGKYSVDSLANEGLSILQYISSHSK